MLHFYFIILKLKYFSYFTIRNMNSKLVCTERWRVKIEEGGSKKKNFEKNCRPSLEHNKKLCQKNI